MQIRIMRQLMLMALIIILCSWGDKGHQKINGSTPLFFPSRLNLFQGWSEKLSEHGSDADFRKEWDNSEGAKHYIDIDAYADFIEKQKIIELKDEAFNQYGKDFIMKNGILPWVTDSTYQMLVHQFKTKEWAKAVLTAADLGHYVGDGFMPLHLTVNYDGKLTGQTGIHRRYESAMVNRYIDEITVNHSQTRKIPNVSRYIFDYIYTNYQYKDSLLNADMLAFEQSDHEYNDLYYQTLWMYTQGFTKKLIAGSSKALAELIISAWIEAGRPRAPREIIFGKEQ